jgi:hypothetical protein
MVGVVRPPVANSRTRARTPQNASQRPHRKGCREQDHPFWPIVSFQAQDRRGPMGLLALQNEGRKAPLRWRESVAGGERRHGPFIGSGYGGLKLLMH